MANAPRIPTWNIEGVCTEARPLVTKKDKTVWAYSIKLMAMGGVFELTTRDEDVFKVFAEGGVYQAVGTFGTFNGSMRFEVTQAKAVA